MVLAALALLPLLVLGVNLMRFLEFRAAMDGGGTPGVAVVERAFVSGSGDETCMGAFLPDGGGPSIEVDIAVKGRCEEGLRLQAILVEPAAFHPDWWGRPTAWTAGTGTGEHLAPVIVTVIFVVPVWVGFWFVRKPLWQKLKQTIRPSSHRPADE
ncbi:hypothetical protein [Glycomyces rhizosphaerae]|uniref:DUF3592 domain-containing protein n=1 Tax=Glycomyces rhizosphaerae TaxID=2054422 RepID=A0ABV7PXG9_9ACTN